MLAPRTQVWAVDVNPRALDLTSRNAAALGLSVRTALPDAVPEDVRFATLWSNPPIRIGKDDLHALLLRWLPRLAEDGEAYLVVQRNLGGDSLHRWLTDALGGHWEVTRHASAKGYRVLKVVRR
jgi:16S rRNA G1207 methylase RsmC